MQARGGVLYRRQGWVREQVQAWGALWAVPSPKNHPLCPPPVQAKPDIY